jgi:two-component system, sensor histidine kinase and response regulator
MSDPIAHILLVEDEPAVRATAEGVLTSFGYAVTAVSDGAKALEALGSCSEPTDLILSDVRMPFVDGFQLLERVRAHPQWHKIPFIIVSARAESADLRMGMSLGADDYVTKPYRPADLRKALEVRLQRARQLSDVSANQQRFLSRILPHELRTPLTAVIGYADLMLDSAAEGKTLPVEALHEYGRMIKQSGESIFRIVKNLMFWQRLETPSEQLGQSQNPFPVRETLTAADLNRLTESIARQMGRMHDVEVTMPPSVTVNVTTPGFEFIASHLIENAFKYSMPGALVRVSGIVSEKTFTLSVADFGRGMTPQQIARIGMFRQFERDRFEQQGLGMGLMLAKTFARMSGGDLELRTGGGGKGMIVSISLPLTSE